MESYAGFLLGLEISTTIVDNIILLNVALFRIDVLLPYISAVFAIFKMTWTIEKE